MLKVKKYDINKNKNIFYLYFLDHVNFEAHFICIKVALEESEKLISSFNDAYFINKYICLFHIIYSNK